MLCWKESALNLLKALETYENSLGKINEANVKIFDRLETPFNFEIAVEDDPEFIKLTDDQKKQFSIVERDIARDHLSIWDDKTFEEYKRDIRRVLYDLAFVGMYRQGMSTACSFIYAAHRCEESKYKPDEPNEIFCISTISSDSYSFSNNFEDLTKEAYYNKQIEILRNRCYLTLEKFIIPVFINMSSFERTEYFSNFTAIEEYYIKINKSDNVKSALNNLDKCGNDNSSYNENSSRELYLKDYYQPWIYLKNIRGWFEHHFYTENMFDLYAYFIVNHESLPIYFYVCAKEYLAEKAHGGLQESVDKEKQSIEKCMKKALTLMNSFIKNNNNENFNMDTTTKKSNQNMSVIKSIIGFNFNDILTKFITWVFTGVEFNTAFYTNTHRRYMI